MTADLSVDAFYLDKVYENCIKAQERVGESSTVLIILVATASILAFADTSDGDVTLPILGVSLSRWLAVEVLAVLSCVAMYRMVSLICYSRILRFKLAYYLDKVDADRTPMWSFMYPSDHLFNIGIVDKVSPSTQGFSRLFRWGYNIFGFFWPLLLLLKSLAYGGISAAWLSSFVLCVVVTRMALTLHRCTPYSRLALQSIDDQLKIADTWRTSDGQTTDPSTKIDKTIAPNIR